MRAAHWARIRVAERVLGARRRRRVGPARARSSACRRSRPPASARASAPSSSASGRSPAPRGRSRRPAGHLGADRADRRPRRAGRHGRSSRSLSAPLVVRADAHQEAVGHAAGVAADLLRGLRVLKGLGGRAAAAAGYRRASGSALRAALDANRLRSAYTGLTFTVAGGFLVVVAWIGGHQALDGDITIGELVAALGLTQFLLGPLGPPRPHRRGAGPGPCRLRAPRRRPRRPARGDAAAPP